LVPFTIIVSFGTAIYTGQVKALLAYNEEAEEEEEEDSATESEDKKNK